MIRLVSHRDCTVQVVKGLHSNVSSGTIIFTIFILRHGSMRSVASVGRYLKVTLKYDNVNSNGMLFTGLIYRDNRLYL